MAKFAFFAVFLAALVAVSVAQGEAAVQRFRDMQCRREVQESPIDACRQVVDRQLAGGMRLFPFLPRTGIRMQCCQQLQDVSRECRCAAIRRMVREYEQTMAPPEEWYPGTETAEQQHEQGYGETAEQQYQQQQQYKQQQQYQQQRQYKQQQQYQQQQQYKQQQQGEEFYGETARQQQGEGYYGEAAHQQQGGGRCIQTAEQSQQGQDNYYGEGRRPIIQGGQQAAGEEFGETTTEQPQGEEYYGSSGRRIGYCPRGHQPAEQEEFGETTQLPLPQQQPQPQQYYGSPDRRTVVRGGMEVQKEEYGEKEKQKRGFIGFPPRFGTEQQTTRMKLMKVRQHAAQLPAMCRMEPQECSVFSAGQY